MFLSLRHCYGLLRQPLAQMESTGVVVQQTRASSFAFIRFPTRVIVTCRFTDHDNIVDRSAAIFAALRSGPSAPVSLLFDSACDADIDALGLAQPGITSGIDKQDVPMAIGLSILHGTCAGEDLITVLKADQAIGVGFGRKGSRTISSTRVLAAAVALALSTCIARPDTLYSLPDAARDALWNILAETPFPTAGIRAPQLSLPPWRQSRRFQLRPPALSQGRPRPRLPAGPRRADKTVTKARKGKGRGRTSW